VREQFLIVLCDGGDPALSANHTGDQGLHLDRIGSDFSSHFLDMPDCHCLFCSNWWRAGTVFLQVCSASQLHDK